ncbi:hypothetical protein NZK35_16665 [Stieleria sp. ICT_E10.1]|uniref:hypothetical protein n=1 Tax=Stieleria sedimenti TaxID=2976331 RepID=UPI00217FDDEF|nr:hypothetical protein [Stieleria sedimenti]MCS7468286.1 hypothetical protein [Stieleria sedimenti]
MDNKLPRLGYRRRSPTKIEMRRASLFNASLLLMTIACVAMLIRRNRSQTRPDSHVSTTTPILQFTKFAETNGVPIAQLTLTNTTNRPIYFAGYGSHRPLQTWERNVSDQWIECDYEWCGTGRSNYSLAPQDSIVIDTALREYRTPEMPDDPPLSAFTTPMRVVLYYGFAEDDIQHPIFGEPFQAGSRQGGEQ